MKFQKGQFVQHKNPNCKCFRCSGIPWNKKEPITLNCRFCKKEYQIRPYRQTTSKFCSQQCLGQNKIGKPTWIKGKKAIWMNNHRTLFKKNQLAWNKGQKRWWTSSTEWKKGDTAKEKNWNWQGGVTPTTLLIRNSLEYDEWRTKVFIRDNYTCVICRQIGGYLHADHIKSFKDYPKLRFEVDNGRTLCIECHYEITFERKMAEGLNWSNYKNRRVTK